MIDSELIDKILGNVNDDYTNNNQNNANYYMMYNGIVGMLFKGYNVIKTKYHYHFIDNENKTFTFTIDEKENDSYSEEIKQLCQMIDEYQIEMIKELDVYINNSDDKEDEDKTEELFIQ